MKGWRAMCLKCSPAPVDSGREAHHQRMGRWTTPTRRPFQAAEGLIMRRESEGQLPRYPADPSPGSTPVVVPIREVLKVGRMNSPEMALAVVTAAGFDETLV